MAMAIRVGDTPVAGPRPVPTFELMTDEVHRYELTGLDTRIKRLEDENKRQREERQKRSEWVSYGFLIVGLLSAYTAVLLAIAKKAAEGG